MWLNTRLTLFMNDIPEDELLIFHHRAAMEDVRQGSCYWSPLPCHAIHKNCNSVWKSFRKKGNSSEVSTEWRSREKSWKGENTAERISDIIANISHSFLILFFPSPMESCHKCTRTVLREGQALCSENHLQCHSASIPSKIASISG